jgi:uncharacterized membrane protein YoaT (DUF817 family)
MGRASEAGFEKASAKDLLTELFVFGLKQARACLFPGIFIAILLLSIHGPLFGLARYDFVFIAAVLAQVALGVETRDEVLTLCAFHVLGVVLEIFKTNPAIGSWTYPGQAGGWEVVSLQKISSWCLLVIVSFVIVADLKHARAERRSG